METSLSDIGVSEKNAAISYIPIRNVIAVHYPCGLNGTGQGYCLGNRLVCDAQSSIG